MARIFQLPRQVPLDGGVVSPGALATFWLTGTTTLTDTYTDDALTTPHTNPVVADAAGVFATIYLDPDVDYKLKLEDATTALIYTEDPVMDTLTQANIGLILYPRTTKEINAGITPTNFQFEPGNVLRYGTVIFSPTTTDQAIANADALQNALDANNFVWVDGGVLNIYRGSAIPGVKIPSNRHLLIKAGSSIGRQTDWGHVMFVNEDWDTGTGTNANENITIECEAGAFFDDSNSNVGGVGDVLAFGHAQHLKFINVTGKNNYWHVIDLAGCDDVLIYGGYFPAGGTNTAAGSEVQFDAAASGAIIGINADDTPTTNVRVRSSRFANAPFSATHIHRDGCKQISIQGCEFDACERSLRQDASIASENIDFSGNIIHEPAGTGSGSPVVQMLGFTKVLKINDNIGDTTTNNQYFAWVAWDTVSRTTNLEFCNNTIRGFSFGARFEEVWRLVVNGNQIDATGVTQAVPYGIKLDDVEEFSVNDNMIFGASVTDYVGISLADTTQNGGVFGNTITFAAKGVEYGASVTSVKIGPNTCRDVTEPIAGDFNQTGVERDRNSFVDTGWFAVINTTNAVSKSWSLGSHPVRFQVETTLSDPTSTDDTSLQVAGSLVYDGTGWIGTVATGVTKTGCIVRTGDRGVIPTISASGVVSANTSGWARVRAWS